jgi:NADPH-dependent 2,4-dienoyl-CoA reductase/sulfur reductase-like enzyme
MAKCLGWTDGLQACRLWQVDQLTCETVLERRSGMGSFTRKSAGPCLMSCPANANGSRPDPQRFGDSRRLALRGVSDDQFTKGCDRRSAQLPSLPAVALSGCDGLTIRRRGGGAGPTGVELCGAIGEIARQTLRHDFRSIHTDEARILLLDGLPRVLMAFPEDLAQKAQRSLERLGVEIQTGTTVKDVDRDGLTVEGGGHSNRIPARGERLGPPFDGLPVSGRRRRAVARASVRRSNCTYGFPVCSFHEDS